MLFCATVLLLGGAACGGGDDDPEADPEADPQPTTTAPSTTADPEAADEEALRALAESWYDQVGRTYSGAADVAEAADFLVDPYLAQFRDQISNHTESGNTIQPSTRSGHELQSIEVVGDTATLVECVVDADALVSPDGSVINDEMVAQLIETRATRTDAGWRFQERELLSEAKGASECDG